MFLIDANSELTQIFKVGKGIGKTSISFRFVLLNLRRKRSQYFNLVIK